MSKHRAHANIHHTDLKYAERAYISAIDDTIYAGLYASPCMLFFDERLNPDFDLNVCWHMRDMAPRSVVGANPL